MRKSKRSYILYAAALCCLLAFSFTSCRKEDKVIEVKNAVDSTATVKVYDFNSSGTVFFSGMPYSGLYAGAPVTFKINSASKHQHWEFGDGSTLDTNSISTTHTYNTAGVYTVTLVVDNDTSRRIKRIANVVPNYFYSCSGKQVTGETIQFSFPAPLPAGDTYLWSFGDGAISFDTTPQHIYTTKGAFEVSLTVNGNDQFKFRKIMNVYGDAYSTTRIARTRNWHNGKKRVIPDRITDPIITTSLGDAMFSLGYVNESTVSYDASDYHFNIGKSTTNEFYFMRQHVAGPAAEDFVYYNRSKDSIYFRHSQSGSPGPGLPGSTVERSYETE